MQDSTARHILETIQYAAIATVDDDGNPWNTPVFCAHDDRGRIYWSSRPDSVHSQNIQRSHKAFIVIYNSKAGEGEGAGLYMEATAEVLGTLGEVEQALTLLGERRGRPFEHPEKFIGEGPQRIYRATPAKCWTNDADKDEDGDFIRDYRVDVHLKDA